MTRRTGRIERIGGPVVEIVELAGARLGEVVHVGPARLLGEIIRVAAGRAVAQIYESPAGLAVGDEVVASGKPLEVELGPGLLGAVIDGIERPLAVLARQHGERPFIERGAHAPALDPARRWRLSPTARAGRLVGPGDVVGTVEEGAVTHRILVPHGVAGTLTDVREGELSVHEPVAWVDGVAFSMARRWPVRTARPYRRRLDPREPMVTGQRVIDTLFPVARGGSCTIPGGFGTGKTVTEQSLAKWADADIVIYIGCGERGNELTEVLEDFPALVDPRTGRSLMERTILIANTSNMPVAAREASIYTGITIAEYFRDQGLHVALLADSTSRWAEALREVSGRLEEMPAEEGYPAYLLSRLAHFYERSGSVVALGSEERRGSVTIIGAVSPPGGDFSEPVTQYSLRLAGTFWALDTSLARRRHFPAIHWTRSYSLYDVSASFAERVAPDWGEQQRWALSLLQREDELTATVQLLGRDALSAGELLVLRTGRSLREDFLQQSAVDPDDAFCALDKQYWMLWTIRRIHEQREQELRETEELDEEQAQRIDARLARMRAWSSDSAPERAANLVAHARSRRAPRVEGAP